MTIEGEEREIGQGDLVHIPPNAVHSLRPVSDHAPIHCFCFAVGCPTRARSTTRRTDATGWAPDPDACRVRSGAVDRRDVETEELDRRRTVTQRREVPGFPIGAPASGGDHFVELLAGHDDDTIGVADHPIAEFDLDITHGRSAPDDAGAVLRRPREREPGGEHREHVRRERGDVAHAAIDHEAREVHATCAAVVSTSPQ